MRSILSIALGCSLIAGSTWTASATGGAIPVGGLSISTEPDRASVYIDGRSSGVSPVQLPAVAAGEHRVRIVKDGYLENARMVTVVAGEPKTVHVKLTRTGDPSTVAGQVVSGAGGGGGSKKWLWIAAAAGGAAGAGLYFATRNHAPIPGTVSVSPTGTGIAAVTSFTFTSQGASDQDGNSLTRTWNFGDGGTGTGERVTREFPNAGTFNVSLTVSDGKAEAKAPDVPVTIRNVNGSWSGTVGGIVRTWTFTQSGRSASGSYTRTAGGITTPGNVTGTLTSPRSISGSATSTGFAPFTFEGTFDSAVSVLTVTANGSGFVNDILTFTRQ